MNNRFRSDLELTDASALRLRDLVRVHGMGLTNDVRRLKAFLYDLSPGCHAENHLLTSALLHGLVDSLKSLSSQSTFTARLPLLIDLFREALSIDSAAALWTVAAWAMALGIVDTATFATPEYWPDPAGFAQLPKPHQQPRIRLAELVAISLPSEWQNPDFVNAWLSDTCPEYPNTNFVLVLALQRRVPNDLLNAHAVELQRISIAQRLRRATALTSDIAEWAVESWAVATTTMLSAAPTKLMLPATSSLGQESDLALRRVRMYLATRMALNIGDDQEVAVAYASRQQRPWMAFSPEQAVALTRIQPRFRALRLGFLDRNPVSDLRATLSDTELIVTWRWPGTKFVHHALLAMRADHWATGPYDPKSSMKVIPRLPDEMHSSLRIPLVEHPFAVYLRMFAAIPDGNQGWLWGKGVQFTAYTASDVSRHVYCLVSSPSISQDRFLLIQAENGSVLPSLVVVGNERQPPATPADGFEIWRSSEERPETSPLRLVLNAAQWPEQSHLRVFIRTPDCRWKPAIHGRLHAN